MFLSSAFFFLKLHNVSFSKHEDGPAGSDANSEGSRV